MVTAEINPILCAGTICALTVLAIHYFPWEMALGGRRLSRPVSYTLGALAMLVPLTWIYIQWAINPPGSAWQFLLALWVVAACAGLAVFLSHLTDWVMHRNNLARELAEIVRHQDKDHGSSDQLSRGEA